MTPNNTIFNLTVAQLIEALQRLPSNLPVLTSGYKSGFENIYLPEIVTLQHEPENPYSEGAFQTIKAESANNFQAVILSRELRDD